MGCWRITEMEGLDKGRLDDLGEALITFFMDRSGELHFGQVRGAMSYRLAKREGRTAAEWSWEGSDQGRSAQGRGWATLLPDGTLEGVIQVQHGAASSFRANKRPEDKAKRSTAAAVMPIDKGRTPTKVVAFNGSPRKDGNTFCLIQHVFKALQAEGIQTELVQLGGNMVHGCTACYQCFQNKNGRCVQDDDIINGCIEKMIKADGIILASPTYFSDVTPELKALIDRAGLVTMASGRALKRKVGAAVLAVRRGGEIHAFDTINHFFLIQEMIVPGSIYWNMGFGREKGEVEKDEEGVRTMKALGENMAWVMKKIRS